MMKVIMKTILAGPDGGASPGEVVEVDNEQGKDLIDGGFAEAIESASVEPPEKAVKQKPSRAKTTRAKK